MNQTYNFRIYIKSIRHYVLNRNKPISKILHKNRKNRFHIFLQFLRGLFFNTSFFKSDLTDLKGKSVGISLTKNQSSAIEEYCDVIITFDKRAKIGSMGSILFLGVPFWKYIFNWIKLFYILRKSRYIYYLDIFSILSSIDLELMERKFSKSNEPIYVSNVNNPIILFFLEIGVFNKTFTHIPHSSIGNTVLPKANLVQEYFCGSVDEFQRMILKYPDGNIRIYERKIYPFKPSIKKKAMIVLPKNWYDVDWQSVNLRSFSEVLIKPHPAHGFLERFNIFLNLGNKVGFKRLKFSKNFNYSFSIYSVSSAVIFELLRNGKFINFLPLKKDLEDHYQFPIDKIKELIDNEDGWKEQVQLILKVNS